MLSELHEIQDKPINTIYIANVESELQLLNRYYVYSFEWRFDLKPTFPEIHSAPVPWSHMTTSLEILSKITLYLLELRIV